MFWFKKKKIVVDCFTDNIQVYDLYKTQKAKHFYPKWWKDLEHTYQRKLNGIDVDSPTIKTCNGFIDLYQQGFVIPLWNDIVIETDENDWKYAIQRNQTQIIWHEKKQLGRTFDNLLHMKIGSPWAFGEKTGVNFLFFRPFWNQIHLLDKMHVPPGVINYKFQCSSEINLFFPRKINRIELFAGDPMAHIIPITQERVELRHHLISMDELERIRAKNFPNVFLKPYLKYKKIREQNESQKKCPFGFGK